MVLEIAERLFFIEKRAILINNSRSTISTNSIMSPQGTVSINNSEDLGKVLRAARKWQQLNQDEVGRFSHSFIGEVEAGKPTAQVGKVLEALRELGIRLHLELPAGMPPP